MSRSSKPEPTNAVELRRRAEARLNNQTLTDHSEPSLHSPQRLLHELQVHQIELEMQNEELRTAQAQVEAGLARYTELYDLAPIGYFSMDPKSAITKVNLAGANLFDMERGLLVGKLFSSFLAAGDRATFEDFLRKAFADSSRPDCEVTLKKREGAPRILRLEATVSPDQTECRAVVTDISARVIAEAARSAAEERLRASQKLEAIGMLAQGIAHDFNNILAAIGGYTEMARWHAKDNPEAMEALNGLSAASSHATDLIRQILTFSRPTKSGREAVWLAPLVQDALKLLRATVPSSILFEVNLASEALMVMASSAEIHQIVLNLATNATYAMRGSKGLLRVTLTNYTMDADEPEPPVDLRPGPYVRLSVTDTGCGMDPATAERVFEPFFTSKDHEGTGLGLAVVQSIVKSMQGVITVVSQPDVGTTFDLYFPAVPEVSLTSASALSVMPRGKGERILYVDDEASISKIMKQMLERLGYIVDIETQPLDALATVRARPMTYALIVTDLTMPELSGIQLAELLLKLRPDLPIILVSGYASILTAGEAAEVGIREVLNKPFSLETLSQAIYGNLHSAQS